MIVRIDTTVDSQKYHIVFKPAFDHYHRLLRSKWVSAIELSEDLEYVRDDNGVCTELVNELVARHDAGFREGYAQAKADMKKCINDLGESALNHE